MQRPHHRRSCCHRAPVGALRKFHRFSVFVTHLRQVAAMLDTDGAEPDCGDRDSAAMGRDLEGHLHLKLELTGHNAVEIEAIINAETDRQYRAAVREHDTTGLAVPAMGVLRARAIVELIRRGAVINPNSQKPAVSVTLTIRADRDGIPTGVHTLDGYNVDAVSTAVLICEAHLQPVIVDGSGNPLNLGHTVRLFTPAQRNALVVRDGGCIFPGCDQPASHCDAHHEIDWHLGGSTDIDNGALLCRRHHGLVHGHNPWTITHLHIDDLPPDLLEQHLTRAHNAHLDPTPDVRALKSPHGKLLLAQNATDHQGPAPP
ncbi:MAG: HNH endonuclease [Microthrixaceae bacterium]|nr:HNH endonuclease [Microthrixaceae bacterium]